MTGPTYNFYNCCCGDETQTSDEITNPSSAAGAVFPFKTIGGDVSAFWNTGIVDRTTPYNYSSNLPQNLTSVFTNMESYPFPFEINDLWFIKGGERNTSSQSLDMDLVVSDYSGAILRTISTQSIDVISAPLHVWMPISLSTTPADLVIQPNEIVVQRFTISAPNTDTWEGSCFVSGLARLV